MFINFYKIPAESPPVLLENFGMVPLRELLRSTVWETNSRVFPYQKSYHVETFQLLRTHNCLKKPWITFFFFQESIRTKYGLLFHGVQQEAISDSFHPFHTWGTPAQVFCYAICQPVAVRCQVGDELWRRNFIIMILFDVTGPIRINLLIQSWTFNWRPAASLLQSSSTSAHPSHSCANWQVLNVAILHFLSQYLSCLRSRSNIGRA